MHFTFLGTSAGTPSRERNVTALALRLDQRSDWSLFDCGEATQHQLLRVPLTLPSLRRIFVSHLHGDHTFGLFGLLSTRSMVAGLEPLDLFGPKGLEELVRRVLQLTSSHLTYELRFHELSVRGGPVLEESWGRVEALPLSHNVTSYAWLFSEAERPGRFDALRAQELGVPDGPLMGQLARGEPVQLADGRQISPLGLCGAPRAGRRVVVAGDNDDPAALLERTGPLDLLVHEATHTEDVAAQGAARGTPQACADIRHSTAARVARAASARGVRNLVLTHFSPRYSLASRADRPWTMAQVEAEARASYAGALFLARDLESYRLNQAGELLLAAPTPFVEGAHE